MTVFVVTSHATGTLRLICASWDAAKVFTDQFDLKDDSLDIREWPVKTLDEVSGFFGL